MLREIWGPAFERDDAYLVTWIWRLRQKIEADPAPPTLLKTVGTRGYQFDVPVEASTRKGGTARC
jgi:DNA-binding response OmpR family regulator